jgi:histidinol-phosphate phosphatase family protein
MGTAYSKQFSGCGFNMNKAIFLDRDGTIAEDVNYCRKVEDFHILPMVPEAIKILNSQGYKVVVITNQSGVARGYFSEERLGEIHHKMNRELLNRGAKVDAIYYCPHHPDKKCNCRKPGIALFNRAINDIGIDLMSSYVIGDRQMDIEAGKTLGCGTVHVTTGPDGSKELAIQADFEAKNLLEAAEWIIKCQRSV